MERAPKYSPKDLSFLEEMAQKFGPNSREYREFLRAVEQDKVADDLGLGKQQEKEKTLIGYIKNTLQVIDLVDLKESSKKDAKILQSQKKESRKIIKELLELALKYVNTIDDVESIGSRKEKISLDDYRSSYQESDARRRRAHNALLAQVAIASRYIIWHFGEISEKQLEHFEEIEEKAGREVLDVKRQKFPPNVLWPEKVNLSNRESIGQWALLISRELADTAIDKII